MPRKVRLPSYRLHSRGQAFVQVRGVRHYLGKWGSPESQEAYRRVIAELTAAPEHSQAVAAAARRPGEGLSVVEIIAAYLEFAESYYRRPDGTQSGHLVTIRMALRPLRELYGETPADEFGPLKLKAVRQAMIHAKLARGCINHRIGCIKRVFRWTCSEELLPASVWHSLATVDGLRAGRTDARETEPIGPVEDWVVEATLPYMPPVVADIVRFMRLTGCRPNEACIVRPCDVDRSEQVWIFRPVTHKTAYRGKDRVIHIGPKAQAVLRPYLLRPAEGYCFSPAESEARRRADLRAKRKTPVQPSQMGRRKAKLKLRRSPCFNKDSLNHAIARAVAKANKAKAMELRRELKPEERIPHWSGNRLRHAKATEVRRQYNLESAQALLGHSRASTTEIYAQKNTALAAEVARQTG